MKRGAVAEIDLDAIAHNLSVIKNLSGNRAVIAVVKAQAYGHGAVGVARRLVREGVRYLAVAVTEEAVELREAGITAPILVLFDADAEDVVRYNLTPVISTRKAAVALSREAERTSAQIKVHMKIDTGMGRLGFAGDVIKEALALSQMTGIEIEGIMSHFSEADLSDTSYARLQIEKFTEIRNDLARRGLRVRLGHLANSAAVITIPESHFDAVRPGLMLYGYSPLQESGVGSCILNPGASLIPAMTVKTNILCLRKLPAGTPISYGRTFITARTSLIGVMPVGYADGLCRRFSNNAEVLVRSRRVPVVGRVCMDLTMIDVTSIEDVSEGDEIVIIGRQDDGFISASELAGRIDTIPYEVLTSLGGKARKVNRGN